MQSQQHQVFVVTGHTFRILTRLKTATEALRQQNAAQIERRLNAMCVETHAASVREWYRTLREEGKLNYSTYYKQCAR